MPLAYPQTDIDYGFTEARTIMGRIGVKVWVYRGEILPSERRSATTETIKYRKVQRGRRLGSAHSGNTVAFANTDSALMETPGLPPADRGHARVFVRFLGTRGSCGSACFPDKSITKKPAETRQGGGKGAPDQWVAVVRRGRIMF